MTTLREYWRHLRNQGYTRSHNIAYASDSSRNTKLFVWRREDSDKPDMLDIICEEQFLGFGSKEVTVIFNRCERCLAKGRFKPRTSTNEILLSKSK